MANPKTVTFEDSQGNQSTAAQPLRTNAQGIIQYNGKAIIALIDGDYSMLMLDATQTEIKDGYIPLVEPDVSSGSSADLTNYTENGLLLADVKQLTIAPGQTARSIGRTAVDDGLGAIWLAVTSTGSPADDTDLIDFDNGLQGVRVKFPNISDDAIDTIMVKDEAITAPKLAITSAEVDWVLARTSEATAGAIGTYAFLSFLGTDGTEYDIGDIRASSGQLAGSNATGSVNGTNVSGSWMCMGNSNGLVVGLDEKATLWLRVL